MNEFELKNFYEKVLETGIEDSVLYHAFMAVLETLVIIATILILLAGFLDMPVLIWIAVGIVSVLLLAFVYRMRKISVIWAQLCKVTGLPMRFKSPFWDAASFVKGDNRQFDMESEHIVRNPFIELKKMIYPDYKEP